MKRTNGRTAQPKKGATGTVAERVRQALKECFAEMLPEDGGREAKRAAREFERRHPDLFRPPQPAA